MHRMLFQQDDRSLAPPRSATRLPSTALLAGSRRAGAYSSGISMIESNRSSRACRESLPECRGRGKIARFEQCTRLAQSKFYTRSFAEVSGTARYVEYCVRCHSAGVAARILDFVRNGRKTTSSLEERFQRWPRVSGAYRTQYSDVRG